MISQRIYVQISGEIMAGNVTEEFLHGERYGKTM
jgi:hypothetical protein